MEPDAARPSESRPTPPCREDGAYGLHPAAHAAIAGLVETVADLVETEAAADLPRLVAEALRPVLDVPELCAPEHRADDDACYARHLLHADPDGRFSVLALVWKPGQSSPVHCHTAWCSVGVYEGHPNVASYACRDLGEGDVEITPKSDERCGPGDVSFVRPGLGDTHRIYNASDANVVTLHVYGCDLVQDPFAINHVFEYAY